jgi:predicted branched-subunit amino acid permease
VTPTEPIAPRRTVIRDSLGVGLAVGAYGFAFGAASVAAGLSVLQTCLLSLLTFTGGTQFAVVGVVAGGGTLAAALGGGLLLGSRNMLYAMRLTPLLRVRGLPRLLAAHGTIDESTAMAIAHASGGTPAYEGVAGGGASNGRVAFWWTFAGVFTVWNLTTLLGAAGTSAIGDPTKFGLDAVVPAAFLALLAPRLRQGWLEKRIALGGAVLAFVLIPVTPAGVPVLASCAALLLAGRMRDAT